MKKLKIILDMIKFEHTIFALPFAYLGMVLGNISIENTWPTVSEFLWVTLAMVGARSAAMALNRIIDRKIDERNPRTVNRPIPAGRISVIEAWVFTIVSFAILFFAAIQLNPLAVQLLPIAVFILVLYSYTKRFTWTCHIILGIAMGLAPLGGWVAATGQMDGTALLLLLIVTLWGAGFDVIYATQDYAFDKEAKLYSIPVRFGIKRALQIARAFHFITAIGLFLILTLTPLHWIYGIGVILCVGILIYEHAIVSPNDLSRLNTAFFTMNGVLSVILFIFTIVDLLVIQ